LISADLNNEATLPIDLEAIKQKSLLDKEENKAFHQFLKAKYGGHIDNDIINIAQSVSSKVNCLHCGNCCKSLQPSVLAEEQEPIAKALSIPTEAFCDKYLEPYEDAFFEGSMLMKAEPCGLLDTNLKCKVYSVRPRDCSSFPHLHKRDFVARYANLIEYYGVCPIVYHSIVALKNLTGFPQETH